MLRIFLDANVYFAGFNSEKGASSLILEIIARGKTQLYTSKLVLREVERNLRLKSKPENLKAFHRYLQKNKIHAVPFPEDKFLESFEALIHPKDLPVLGAAILSKADYLISLDRRHFLTNSLQSKLKKPVFITPGDFLREVYLKGKL